MTRPTDYRIDRSLLDGWLGTLVVWACIGGMALLLATIIALTLDAIPLPMID